MPSKYRVTSCVQLTRDLFAIAKFWFISITIAIIFLRFFGTCVYYVFKEKYD